MLETLNGLMKATKPKPGISGNLQSEGKWSAFPEILIFLFCLGLPICCLGQQSVVLVTSPNGCSAIAIDNTYLYWASGSAIHKVPKAGGPDSILTSITNGVSAITAFGNYLYWAESSSSGYGAIRMMPTTGGAVTTVVKNATMAFVHRY